MARAGKQPRLRRGGPEVKIHTIFRPEMRTKIFHFENFTKLSIFSRKIFKMKIFISLAAGTAESLLW